MPNLLWVGVPGRLTGVKRGRASLFTVERCDICDSPAVGWVTISEDLDTGAGGAASLNLSRNDNGCSEQTSLASTPTDRNKAQNNWAPKSREPCIVRACLMKSSLERKTSASLIMDS